MSRNGPRPKRRIYAWPEAPNQSVTFPYRSLEYYKRWKGSTRIVNAAHGTWYCKRLGWKPHVKSTPKGIIFWWEIR